jgi:hypothetical protein
MLLTVDVFEDVHDAGVLNSLRALFCRLLNIFVEIFLRVEKSDLALLTGFFVSQLQPVVEAQTLFIVIKSQIIVSLMVLLISFRLNVVHKEVKSGKFSCTIFIKVWILMKQSVK